nr:hypothetical protein [Mesorhizobium metallidurans]
MTSLPSSIGPTMKATCVEAGSGGGSLAGLAPSSPIFARTIQRIALDPPTLNGATACGANMPSSEAFETRDRMSRSMLFPSSTSIPVDVESTQNAAVTSQSIQRSQDVL